MTVRSPTADRRRLLRNRLLAGAAVAVVLVALSVLVWPLPVAAALSYVGTLLGCVVTIAALAAAGAGSAVQVDTWPRSLQRLATRVARHPLLVGLSVRVVLQSGVAVEGFFRVTATAGATT